ncbi:hypothetical protein [Undibacterium sp.]|uniref:hypothetical protein n=1 Tax=Undibacterium sp. TaxID=1914977 RepID=UPI0025ED3695|nr:hypothetical protein [Undibacterium sp.]
MINTTKSSVIFNKKDADLRLAIIAAFRTASRWILAAYDLQSLDLATVTTKTNNVAAFPAYVELCILLNPSAVFDEQYVLDALAFVLEEKGDPGQALSEKLTMAPSEGPRGFRKAFSRPLRRGFGAFLVSLHCKGVITLPYSFRWPIALELGEKRKVLGRKDVCPHEELPSIVALFRNCEPKSAERCDPVYSHLNVKQRERLAYRGGKVLTALGWLKPEHANYDDLLEFKRENVKSNFAEQADNVFMVFIDILCRKFGHRVAITPEGWQNILGRRGSSKTENRKSGSSKTRSSRDSSHLALQESCDTAYLVEQAFNLSPSEMSPAMLERSSTLPGLDFELDKASHMWVRLQNAYLKKVQRENDKARLQSMGYLNMYLFGYLPYWYSIHPTFQFEYPNIPNKLISAVFIADLGLYEADVKPLPFVEFLNRYSAKRKWGAATHYAALKQVEKFFDFVIRVGPQTQGCENFVQPIGQTDYPALSRSRGTNKKPIPRRIFKFYLQYIEALSAYLEAFLERIVSGEIHEQDYSVGLGHTKTTIDTFEMVHLIAFVPVIFHKNKTIPLRYIPNVLFLDEKNLANGTWARIPHPHALYQILVSLFTGIRQQHIQWLDEATFDQEVPIEGGSRDYAELFVNTDKVKTKPWKSFVNFRVIEILRKQRAWRNLVDEPGFMNRIPYNGNSKSKWGTILPVFAYGKDGAPHSDSIYSSAWRRIIAGVQSVLLEIDEPNIKLIRFLPNSIQIDDVDIDEKLFAYGKEQKRKCDLHIKSAITPHSSRVSVVSHSISILPADLIGKYWTGQTEATVHHYVVLDDDEIFAEQQLQNLQLRNKGYERGYEAMLEAVPGRISPYVAADGANSHLSESIKKDLDETLIAYGCVSLSLDDEGKTGLDVLRETRAVGAAMNKTEICPFGNHCPKDVVVKLGGFKRCGPCNFAVRSIDHLPAVTAKIRQVFEQLSELNKFLEDSPNGRTLTSTELDDAESQRDRLSEDLAAWQMSAEVLEMMRQRVARGESDKTWHIQKPEVIERHLRRVSFPSSATDYLLARLAESEAFPMLESSQIRSRFELLRRKLLANAGKIQEAFSLEVAVNPAAECLGLIRSIVGAHNISIYDLTRMLEGDGYLKSLPAPTSQLLGIEALR